MVCPESLNVTKGKNKAMLSCLTFSSWKFTLSGLVCFSATLNYFPDPFTLTLSLSISYLLSKLILGWWSGFLIHWEKRINQKRNSVGSQDIYPSVYPFSKNILPSLLFLLMICSYYVSSKAQHFSCGLEPILYSLSMNSASATSCFLMCL